MKNQKRIVFFVGIIVLVTISIQFYWNYIQYKNNKQQIINEIQISLDNAVDDYYTELSKRTVFGAYYSYNMQDSVVKNVSYNLNKDHTNPSVNVVSFVKNNVYGKPIKPKDIKSFHITGGSVNEDTILKKRPKLNDALDELSETMHENAFKAVSKIDSLHTNPNNIKSINYFKGKNAVDSMNSIKDAVMKIIVSVKFDSINFNDLKFRIDNELNKKNILFDYSLIQKNQFQKIDSLKGTHAYNYPFVATSNSALLPNENSLEMHYPNIFWIALKKGFFGILLSLILSGAVIFMLFYLVLVIRKQKQLSEIKNDFISNITHELKTPIATVTSAVEAMQKFNEDNNPQKTQKYLDISAVQLDKLKVLVDKILETSVLESKDLILEKENTDLVKLVKTSVEKHKISTLKEIRFSSDVLKYEIEVDAFHFENAISNLIENAIKYGGNKVKVSFKKIKNEVVIEISDNGTGISTSHQNLIFDKFYRVPNNNKHNIKGFGIGLYYTKNIIEKHNGTIELIANNPTTFCIRLCQK